MFKKILTITVCLIAVAVLVFSSGVIVTDHSAVYSSEGLNWNGSFYKVCSGVYEEGKTVAKTTDGNWSLNVVENDKENNFIVVRSFLDSSLLVRSDYKISENGSPDLVYLGNNKIENAENRKIISDIFLNNGEIFSVTATHNDVNNWQAVYIGFENCPVAIFRGYIGFVDENYFFTVDVSDMKENDNGNNSTFNVICKSVNKSDYALLDEYFQ